MAQQTIIAYFDSREEAKAAQAGLINEGIAAEAIKLLPEEGSTYTRGSAETSYDHRKDEGGFWKSLGNVFLPDEDRYSYAEGMSRGGVALSVTTDAADYDRVADMLDQMGADNLDERETEWKSAGWSGLGTDTTAAAASADLSTATGVASEQRVGTAEDEVVQVVEEELRVGKRQVDKGRVRIRSYIVETPVQEEVTLQSERVEITRRAVDRPLTGATEDMFRERTFEAEERAEEVVISKEARVVEEIALNRKSEEHVETVSDTVRKTEVEIVDERAETTGRTGVSREPKQS